MLGSCGSDPEGTELRDPVTTPVVNTGDLPLPASTCLWDTLSSSSETRLESQTALVGRQLFTFSGFTDGLVISPVTEIYDLDNDQWSLGAPMPVAVTHMGAALVNGKVWIAGGFVGDHPGTATGLVQIYDPVTDTWSQGPSLPSPRASGALVYLEGVLHYFGGLLPDRQTDLNEHLVLDLQASEEGWKERAELPYGRNHLGGVALAGYIYAVGGQHGHDGLVDDVAYLHRYDSALDTWQQLSDLPTDRSHFEPGIFTYREKIILVGGRIDDDYAADVIIYDPDEDRWSPLCDLPEALLAPVARIHDDRLLVVNGGAGGVCCPLSSVWYITMTAD